MVVRHKETAKHFPLNRLASLSIAKNGVSISSDLLEALSVRGVKVFFRNFKGEVHSTVIHAQQHAVVQVRLNQSGCIQNAPIPLMRAVVSGKIANQRAVLNYFNKYHHHAMLADKAYDLKGLAARVKKAARLNDILGLEGMAARFYFEALAGAQLFSASFKGREGRGSTEINNAMLNYGYAVLYSAVLSAIVNAGLEPYLGFLHQKRPGKMALVLDMMEEYRAWVVDRNVIKLRHASAEKTMLDTILKRKLIDSIQNTLAKRYPYRGKKVRLEHIVQRQVYRLSGHFSGQLTYKPYFFKW